MAEWIPVTERLPEEPYGCLLIVWDSPYNGGDDFLNYLPYFAGWDGEQWNDGDGQQVPFEVAFWMPLPEPPMDNEYEAYQDEMGGVAEAIATEMESYNG